jgi:hypothetical protein
MKIRYISTLIAIFLFTNIQAGTCSPSNPAIGINDSILKRFISPLMGENVLVFDPGMDMKLIQEAIDTIFARQTGKKSEFSRNRYALLFQPGKYDLDIRVEYYMQVLGLGKFPDDVIINGAVRSNTTHGNSVLTNFWRSVENLAVIPAVHATMIWGVSQAAPLRRVHIMGNLQLYDKGYASGGFIADSKIDGTVTSGPQQQWLSRNTEWQKWSGGNWNMMFIGVPQAPEGNWPDKPYTTIKETPVIREKPYLSCDEKGFNVRIQSLKKNSTGPGWTNNSGDEKVVYLDKFYIVKPDIDNSESINNALRQGKNLLITPGRYFLNESLKVTQPGTIVMGLGLATLIPVKGNAAIEVADAGGIIICGLTIDAGSTNSERLFSAGDKVTGKRHKSDPLFLYDLFFRVGGPAIGSASACMEINTNDVCIDHIWLWRADHGNGVGWEKNRCANGIIVNGDNVTIYGLFNEHFQEYQTLWNGDNGRVYFYQSEMPYDPPTADSWKHDSVMGYASYKVSARVKNHEAWGLGIYNVFYNAPVVVDNAIEAPPALEGNFHHVLIYWLNGNKESTVRSVINGKGGSIGISKRKAVFN